VGGPRLTPRSFGVALGLAARERSRLAPGGALRGFQFLPQPFNLLPQPRPAQFPDQPSNTTNRVECFENQTILYTKGRLLSAPFPEPHFYWVSTR